VNEQQLYHTGVIVFAVAGAFVKWLNAGEHTSTTIRQFVVEVITAVFCGFGCIKAGEAFALNEGWVYLSAGFFGWMGAEGIGLVIKKVTKQFFGVTPPSGDSPGTGTHTGVSTGFQTGTQTSTDVTPIPTPTIEIPPVEIPPQDEQLDLSKLLP